MFSYIKRKGLQELETMSENKACEKAAQELGLKITYKTTNETHIFPPEEFKIVIVDFKNVSPETKIKFEELQNEYQQQEYKKMLKSLAKRVLLTLSIFAALGTSVIVSTCTKNNNSTDENKPKLIQKSSTSKNIEAKTREYE